MTALRLRRPMRALSVLCVLLAALMWLQAGKASALAPDKTAWYDALGLQTYTGETTPSVAGFGQLEVAYVPVSVTVPSETLPDIPITPPTLPPSVPVGVPVPDLGRVGGMTIGDTLAFAAVEYTVPLQVGGQAIDPNSLRAELTLSLDPNTSIDLSSGDIVACPTTNALWASGADQPSNQAAPYDCAPGMGVSGNYDASSHTMSFALSSAQEYQAPSGPTGIFSVVLAPGSSPSGPFMAVFDAPSSSSFVITGESPASNNEDNLAGSGVSSGNGLTNGFGPSGVDFGGIPGLPSTGVGEAGGTSPVSTSPITAVTTPGTVALGTPADVSATRGLSSGSQRMVAVILLAALGAGLWMAASQTGRRPRSLRQAHSAPTQGD
jgi:hypothetical protein